MGSGDDGLITTERTTDAGDNRMRIKAGTSLPAEFETDEGTAKPDEGVLKVLGGDNIRYCGFGEYRNYH